MNFVNGMPSTPVYSDAYLIDAGVCLLAPSTGKVRRMVDGEGRLALLNPLNRCFLSFLSCRSAMALLRARPTSTPSRAPATQATEVRRRQLEGWLCPWSSSDTLPAPLLPGTFCEYCTGSQCSAPQRTAGASAASTAGDVAAGVLGGVLAAGLLGLLVYVRFFGGGPAVVSAASCITGAVAGGKSGGGAPLLKPSSSTATARFSSIGSSSL